MLSAIFIPNAYRDEVIWNFVGALGCTLLSIWLFVLFCKDRRKNGYFAGSYLAWFVAIATYTIQIGAVGGVFFISLRNRLSAASWSNALVGATLDTLPYVAFLALYVMIWITTSPAGVPTSFHLQFSFDALAKSIVFGIWHEHYHLFWIWATTAGPRLMASSLVCRRDDAGAAALASPMNTASRRCDRWASHSLSPLHCCSDNRCSKPCLTCGYQVHAGRCSCNSGRHLDFVCWPLPPSRQCQVVFGCPFGRVSLPAHWLLLFC